MMCKSTRSNPPAISKIIREHVDQHYVSAADVAKCVPESVTRPQLDLGLIIRLSPIISKYG
jgi:hypothetical protein